MSTPNFYNINFEREVVVQGKNTTFLSITRNDEEIGADQDLVIVLYPQRNTWEQYKNVSVISKGQDNTYYPEIVWKFQYTSPQEISKVNDPKFERIFNDLEVLNWYDIDPNLITAGGVPLTVIDYKPGIGFSLKSLNNQYFTPPNNVINLNLGKNDITDADNWKINAGVVSEQIKALENQISPTYWKPFDNLPNPFDGTTLTVVSDYGKYTGFFSRKNASWIRIPKDNTNVNNNGASIRIDFDGKKNSHLKLNILVARMSNLAAQPQDLVYGHTTTGEFGWKIQGASQDESRDYQEVHFFGYTEDYVKTKRDNTPVSYKIENPIYDDQASYALLKTNPKISGNVKLTTDSNGDIWLNSFDANDELANSSYKKYAISPSSTYQRDLHYFFKKGKTPSNIVFEPYQFDNQYLNTKRTFEQQYDNFYNYGVEQLRSKLYDEDFTFLAPLWLRKDVPDFFLIFRIDGPLNIDSYLNKGNDDKFNSFFAGARLIKTFDMRNSSKLGSYIRKIVNDPRYQERPIEVSWETDVATYWNGLSYKDGTMTAKGEFLYDYYKQDRPIKEFEEFVTNGFERNGIISSNLLNLEFLFDDDEADLYSINRYFGIYVNENQLAEFQIEPSVLGKIQVPSLSSPDPSVLPIYQTPPPKPGVDGEPYTLREFTQTNPDGIQLPIHYYHNSVFTNNTTNIPEYQGNVIGKLPLPAMVDDPLRFFYVKDRNDVFKRVNKLTEVDYGVPGSKDYIRATQLQLFDNEENISSYGGVTNITSQLKAELLDSGKSQLVLELFDQAGTGVIAEDEEFIINVENYNDYSFDDDVKKYYVQVTDTVLGNYVKVKYFIGDYLTSTTSSTYIQPPVNDITPVAVEDASELLLGDFIYIIGGGYYQITGLNTVIAFNNIAQIQPKGQPVFSLGSIQTNTVSGATPGITICPQLSNSGNGIGANFNVTVDGTGAVTVVSLNLPGTQYTLSDVITIDLTPIGGSGTLTISPATLLEITYNVINTTSSGNGTGAKFTVSYDNLGVMTVLHISGGSNYVVGDTITIPASEVGGLPGTDITFDVTVALYSIIIKNLGLTGNAPASTIINGFALIGKHFDGEQTYYVNPISTNLQLDTYLTINLYGGTYSVGDCWEISVDNGKVIKTQLGNTTHKLDAFIPQDYGQFRWRLIANGTGLQPGDSWDYPIYDPNGIDYITHFSPEGTAEQVAAAITKAVSTFDNIPVKSYSKGSKVYLKGKLEYEDGNTILLTRNLKPTSYYTNVGFYEKGFCNRKEKLSQITIDGSPLLNINLNTKFVEYVDQPTDTYYYIKIEKNDLGAIVSGKLKCLGGTYANLTSTGTLFWDNLVGDVFEYSGLPISLDISKLVAGETYEVAYSLTSTSEIKQNFIGGTRRKRNRAKVSYTDGTKYFIDRRSIRLGNTVNGSKTIKLDTSDLYVGAAVSGNGIPANTFIVDVNANDIKLNNAASVTASNVTLNIGEITALNDNKINNQWFQSLKGMYSQIKGWDVQGKFLYSLPYLEEPTYNEVDEISSYTSLNENLIIQIENPTQEIYITDDKRIVAWDVYKPVIGIFSLYPIKEFDFDFILSDYSYTPTLEIFPYFYKETLKENEEIELSINENYKLESRDKFSLEISVKNPNDNIWYNIDTLTFNGAMGTDPSANLEILFNTFYPLYVYDKNEYPYLAVGPKPDYTIYQNNYNYRGTGKRNFERIYLKTENAKTGAEEIFYPETLKIKYIPISPLLNPELIITKYNYEQDLDLKQFNGFAGLQDITSVNDISIIQDLKNEGKYLDAFTYQLLLSEYDRLRENFNIDWAVKSIVVPYVNKWVLEGTDARDNYYRLNNSMAFGINNMSPSDQIDFTDTSVLTNEFPYIDATPKDYFVSALEGSRSYMFQRLDDVAYDGKTWYELLTTNNENDWFTKYFSVGYPTEETYSGDKITKSREERFTFFRYINGLGKSQTVFRGVKIQAVTFDDAGIDPIEISDSTYFDDYKFASVARFVKPGVNFDKETPVKIEVIKNDTYKTIVMIFTVYVNDYRTQSGHNNYFLQYVMNDILKNENQNQLPFISSGKVSLALKSFLPYGPLNNLPPYIYFNYFSPFQNQVARPRQGFLGGGYLQLGNKRLGGNLDFRKFTASMRNSVTGEIVMPFKNVLPTYSFNMLNELSTTVNNYNNDLTKFIINKTYIRVYPKELTKEGFFSSFSTASKDPNAGFVSVRNFFDSQVGQVSINPLSLKFFTSKKAGRTNVANYASLNTGLEYQPFGMNTTSTSDKNNEVETYIISGGTNGYVSTQKYLTIGNIQFLVNSESPAIEYYNVGSTEISTKYRIRFVSPDSIIKDGVLQFADDTDKPQEYSNVPLIGYDIVDTNTQEYMLRHRGYYEPKARDIISFWVRENNEFSNHYEKDFLLGNTHINTSYSISGLLRNYGINKVATSGEVLKIARESAYKSLYPLIDEVSVDSITAFALNSSWDDKFYRDYATTSDWVNVEGIAEMKELKSFLASKAMNIPKSHEFNTFNNTEVTYVLDNPTQSIGVNYLAANNSSTNQQLPNSDKPVLTININVKDRLLRQLIEDINSGSYTDEFGKLPYYSVDVPVLHDLTSPQINTLKTNYFNKNIINLYYVSEINLWSVIREGVQLMSLELTELDKSNAGYNIDKDCVVTQVTDYNFKITKTLDTKVPSGFALSILVKRI